MPAPALIFTCFHAVFAVVNTVLPASTEWVSDVAANDAVVAYDGVAAQDGRAGVDYDVVSYVGVRLCP